MQRWLLAILILLAPLAGCTGDTKELEKIPEFTVLTEENGTVSNNNFENQAFVIVFSAQWCGTPCHNNMHNLNLTSARMAQEGLQLEIEVLVISTDVDEEPNGRV